MFLLTMVRTGILCVILSSVFCHSLFCLLHTPPINKVDKVVSCALSCGLLQVMMRMRVHRLISGLAGIEE